MDAVSIDGPLKVVKLNAQFKAADVSPVCEFRVAIIPYERHVRGAATKQDVRSLMSIIGIDRDRQGIEYGGGMRSG